MSSPLQLSYRSKVCLPFTRNDKSIVIASLDSQVQPLHVPLPNGGSAFWLDSRTVAHVVETGEDKDKNLELLALSIDFKPDAGVLDTVAAPVSVGTFPTLTATNFRYSLASGYLVFSDYVYADGSLSSVKEKDEEWENRGTTALVFDSGYPRHWDHWLGPKKSALFSVRLAKTGDGTWELSNEFIYPLAYTRHASPRPSVSKMF